MPAIYTNGNPSPLSELPTQRWFEVMTKKQKDSKWMETGSSPRKNTILFEALAHKY